MYGVVLEMFFFIVLLDFDATMYVLSLIRTIMYRFQGGLMLILNL